MEEEKIQELLEYLAKIGFPGAQLEVGIRQQLLSEKFEFRVIHELSFDNEKVLFELNFQRDSQFNAYRLTDYIARHQEHTSQKEHVRKFTASPRGICNPNLAYHIVSGRFDDLIEKIATLNLGEFPGVDPHPNLENFLSRNADAFTLKCSRNESEGYIEYDIPVLKINGWYTLNTYTATLTLHPEITHGTFNSINTKELEDEMRKVNWQNDRELYVLQNDTEPEILSPAIDILDRMLKLADDAQGGSLIADKLMIKYWSDASYFDSFIKQRAWDYLDTLPKREQSFPIELEAKAAFNLLCGRAILQNRVYPSPNDKPTWIRFNFTTRGPNGGYHMEIMPELNQLQLEAILNTLPISHNVYFRIMSSLQRGDITPLVLPNDKNIFLEANPEQKTVNIYSEDMRPIEVNFHFDPDWKSTQNPESKPEELKRKPLQKIIQPGKTNRFNRRR